MKHLNFHRLVVVSLACVCTFLFLTSIVSAKDKESAVIARCLKNTYQAKRKRIPFMGLARFAVRIVRPAGVKSFDVMLFENLSSPNGNSGRELGLLIERVLGHEWQTLVRVRERNGEQTYIYAKDEGKNLKLFIVNIDGEEAAIVRVTLDPTALAKWIDNPKLFGISLREQTSSNPNRASGESLKHPENALRPYDCGSYSSANARNAEKNQPTAPQVSYTPNSDVLPITLDIRTPSSRMFKKPA